MSILQYFQPLLGLKLFPLVPSTFTYDPIVLKVNPYPHLLPTNPDRASYINESFNFYPYYILCSQVLFGYWVTV